jgi:hypothetical protein
LATQLFTLTPLIFGVSAVKHGKTKVFPQAPEESSKPVVESLSAQKTPSPEKKVWYKDAANLISGLALLVATIAIVQTHDEHKNHELESLEQIAVEIVENQKALNELPANQADAVLSSNIQSFLVQKGNTLASRGIELAKNYNGHGTPEILFAIGYQAALGGHYVEAEDLYRRAIEESDSALAKSGPRLALARLYFVKGSPSFSVEKGETLYKDALAGMGTPTNPTLIYQTGYLYETWAEAEFETGRADSSVLKLANAETLYRSLPLWDGNRRLALQRIDQTRSKQAQTSDEGQTLAKRLVGKWTVADQPEGYSAMTLTISVDSSSGLLSGTLYQANVIRTIAPRLEEAGPIVLGSQHSAVFTWEGTDALLGAIAGKTALSFNDDMARIYAVEERPGQNPIKYTFRR